MNGILDTETKLWNKKHGSIKNFFCKSDLKIKEGQTYDVCQVWKQTKMSCKMLQHLTHVYELPLMEFMRLMQGVFIEGNDDGQA